MKTNLEVLLCCVHRSAIFNPGDAGWRDATGDALQTDGLLKNHWALGMPGPSDGWRNSRVKIILFYFIETILLT